MSSRDPLLELLARFHAEGVEYVLVGGQAVRINGFLRATEDIDFLIRPGRENGRRIIRALGFLASSKELDAGWFEPTEIGELENIRVADELIVDLLFAANGETYESIAPHIREISSEGIPIRVLDIDGLIKTKTDYRDKDKIDKQALAEIKRGLEGKN
ncbi:MAG: hypothetical protein ACKVQQ_18490 [Burkholderiales bacterium]